MGRQNRKDILYDGCYSHVFSRAAEKRYIFNGAEDFARLPDLELEVMTADIRTKLHLFDVYDMLLFPGRSSGLLLLKSELPVVHYLDDGWSGQRRNFH